MILDNQAILSDNQALTAATLTPSQNILDLGKAGVTGYNKAQLKRLIGKGSIPMLIQVTEDFAGTIASLNIKVQASSVEDFSSDVENVISFDVPVAKLIAGFIAPVEEIPREVTKRYFRLAYTPNAAATAGKITAGIVAAVDGAYRGN